MIGSAASATWSARTAVAASGATGSHRTAKYAIAAATPTMTSWKIRAGAPSSGLGAAETPTVATYARMSPKAATDPTIGIHALGLRSKLLFIVDKGYMGGST